MGDFMKLYNTLTKTVDEFVPNNKDVIKMYTCGPTVYHFAHIGNMRTYISEDILEKSLKFLGYKVERVMNITDVGHLAGDGDVGEDKMSLAAKREKKSSYEIAKYYTDCFFNDCSKLNVKKPDIVSNATDNIDVYINMISKLLDEGYAYEAGGNIYYDTSKFVNYYELSGRNKDDLLVAVRNDVEVDSFKKNVFDFGLWFTNSKFNNQELQWDSPWGRGYPGWHLECSAISIKYLGEYLDIHCGAEDAVFPHHTNEIAQSEAYLGHKWCNHWVHLGFLNDNSGKMSKSKGEFLTVSLLEEKGFDPLSYRYLCLNSCYRNQLTFSYDILSGAQHAYYKLKSKVKILDRNGDLLQDFYNNYIEKFKDAINDDLNTSNMLTLVYDVLKDDTLNSYTKFKIINDYDRVLSLNLCDDSISTVQIDSDFEMYILDKIKERDAAKNSKNYFLADKIRDELLEKKVKLIDTREGTLYELIDNV